MQFTNGVIINNKMWAIELKSNSLFSIDLISGEVHFEISLANSKDNIKYESIEKIDDENIVVAPFMAEDFLLINLRKKSVKHIVVDWRQLFSDFLCNDRKIGKMLIYNNVIYAIGFSVPGIVAINLDSLDYSVFNYGDLFKNSTNISIFSFKSAIIKENHIIVPLYSKPTLLDIDLENQKTDYINILSVKGIQSIGLCKDILVGLSVEGELVLIHGDGKQIKLNNSIGEQKYIMIYGLDEMIYRIPFLADNVDCININNNKRIVIHDCKNIHGKKFVDAFIQDNHLYLFEFSRFNLIDIDMRCSKKTREIRMSIDEEVENYMLKHDEIYDEKVIGLSRYLEIVVQ